MTKRVLLALFFALVICGMSFYLFLFPALMYVRITGPANPPTATALQSGLRHVLVPVCIALGLVTFVVSFRRLGKRDTAMHSS